MEAEQNALEGAVQEKPVFWHSLHRRMWDIIAELNCSKITALAVLAHAGASHTYVTAGHQNCFACAAGNPGGPGVPCKCPLDWPDSAFTHPCISTVSDGTNNGLYMRWAKLRGVAGSVAERKALAEQIRDLPLSEHATLYTIR